MSTTNLVDVGLIPAHAGKTLSLGTRLTLVRAHPRACGENERAFAFLIYARGSSPRMRGKLEAPLHPKRDSRLIPAHAGKTERASPANHPPPAHPRACGENTSIFGVCSGGLGSSPRMRGKLPLGSPRRQCSGLIPAHAGKTATVSRTIALQWAHPRACGENAISTTIGSAVRGSSPRMRGKP